MIKIKNYLKSITMLVFVFSFVNILSKSMDVSKSSAPVIISQQPIQISPVTRAQQYQSTGTMPKFTQTEAYFQSPQLRELVTKEFKNERAVVNHMAVVSHMMAKEAELRKTHWAFYHGIINEWTVWQDTLTKLSAHFNPTAESKNGEFIFLRTKGGGIDQSPIKFLTEQLRAHGLVDDNNEAKGLLLSTNFSPFGNTGFEGESTWRYFMRAHSHVEPSEKLYQAIMDEFQLPYTYINELMSLVRMLHSKHEAILQIFIPKQIVDDTAYLAWVAGTVAYNKIINWVRDNVENKKYRSGHGKSGEMRALESLKRDFKKEQERNPLFKSMLESVEKGEDYSVDAYLNRYCNDPLDIPNLNYIQARLILSNDILLSPQSGIKMFRYTEIDNDVQDKYEEKLNAIIKKIIASKR